MSYGIMLDYDKWEKPHKSIIHELDELEEDTFTPLLGEYRTTDKKSKKMAVDDSENISGDDWLTTIASFRQKPTIKKGYKGDSIFNSSGKKKKGKKKEKGERELKDYQKEFETEMGIMQNLLIDQNNFVESLQKRYNILETNKSSSRGIGKFTTDLISAINQGRSTSMQIVDKIISTKKTIADLNIKERKEFGSNNMDGELSNLSEYSAQFLKQMINKNRMDLKNYGDGGPVDGNLDDIFDGISENLGDDMRDDTEVEQYLKYENRSPKIIAIVNKDSNEYRLQAISKNDGEILEDYPIPEISKLEINRSTNVAVDEYHNKYDIQWE